MEREAVLVQRGDDLLLSLREGARGTRRSPATGVSEGVLHFGELHDQLPDRGAVPLG